MRNNTKQYGQVEQFGKLPPNATDLEENIIGALMIDKQAYSLISDMLIPECFYVDANQRIYEAISQLGEAKKPIDMSTVTEQLRKNGTLEEIGGAYKIALLTGSISTSAHIQFHTQVVYQKYISRQLIRFSSEIQELAYNDTEDLADILDKAEDEFTKITASINTSDGLEIQEAVSETINRFAEIQNNRNKGISTHIRTPLTSLNEAIIGWQAPDLYILGGRPAMGKTQLAVLFAEKAATNGRVLFFSLEMSIKQLVTRLITKQDGINYSDTKEGTLTHESWRLIDKRRSEIEQLDLKIIDDAYTLASIKSIARTEKRKRDIDFIVIDYLQLIQTNMKFGTRDIEVGYITRNLKMLCKELNTPILLLAQLSRPTKGAKVSRPQLQDLRESGNIEQDADMVMFVHRPAYYGEQMTEGGESTENMGEIIISKFREGKTGTILFSHDKAFKNIFDYIPSNPVTYSEQIKSRVWEETEQTAIEDIPF